MVRLFRWGIPVLLLSMILGWGSYGLTAGAMVLQSAEQEAQGKEEPQEGAVPVPETHEQGKGAIQGVVTRLNGEPIANVQLTLSNDQGFTVTVQTDENGQFFIDNVPPGTYQIKVEKEGFKTFTDTQTIEADKLLTYRVRIPTIEEATEVRGGEEWKKGEEAFKRRDFAEAERHFQNVVARDPTYANAYFNLGITQGILGKCDVALENLQRAIDLQFAPSGNLELMYHAVRARCFEQKRQWEQVVAEYQRLIEMLPQNAAFYLNIARAYIQMGHYEQAIEAYRKFLQLEPRAPEARQVRDQINKLKELVKQQKEKPSG